MKNKTVQRSFPKSEVSLLHQSGAQLSEPTKGVHVLLHTRKNETDPCCAELISGEHHAEIGLSFNGKELADYDGVFSLPREVGEMLKDAGYIVPEDCFR
jgi:hypothetical protein